MSLELNDFLQFEKEALQLYNLRKLNELEKKRKQALSEYDSMNYYFLTDLLGLNPEDESLFKKGAEFVYYLKKEARELKISQENKKVKDFLVDAEKLLNSGSKNADDYRKCLSKHFFKFSHKGERSVYKIKDYTVIVLFENVYESYKKN